MPLLALLWAGILAGGHLPVAISVWLTLAGVLVSGLALTAARQRIVLVLALCLFPIGVMRSPELGTARPIGGDRFPVVLRIGLPFPAGQCREETRVRVEEVIVGSPGLLGRQVIARGLDPGRRSGQRVMLVSGTFYAPQPARNPMAYDARARARREGVAGSVRVKQVIEEKRALPDRALAGLRSAVRRVIAGADGERARGVLEAMLLGDRGDLSPEVRSIMVRAGTYHVLAISGLHVGILVFMISILVAVMRLGRARRVAVSLALVVFYVVFAGMRPSAMRAAALFLVLCAARLLQHRVDYTNAVCFAAAALLMAAPHLAWDLGFRLSFGAVFGMTLFLPALAAPAPGRLSAAARARAHVRAGLLAAFTAQVFTAPLILWNFGRISIIAGISNLLVLPLISLALTAGMEGAVLSGVLPGLGSVFMRSASVLVAAAIRVADALGGCADPLVYPGRPHVIKACAYYAAVLWLGLFPGRLGRRAKLALLGGAFAFMLLRMPASPGGAGRLEVTFLDVGSGDACVMELPDGGAVLVDTGPSSADYDAATAVVLPFLALRGIGALEKLIITHPHNDHYGGIPALIENIPVGEILVSTTEGEEDYLADLSAARRSGVPVRRAAAGDSWESGPVRFEVLHPGRAGGPGLDVSRLPGERDDPNAWSMVIKATLGESSVLVTGDLTPAVQESLVARGADLACDVLKVPHHGHPGETSPVFARSVDARLAVISCGTRYFDTPESATKILLEEAGMRVFSTRTHGAVQVSTDGCELSVSTVLERSRGCGQ